MTEPSSSWQSELQVALTTGVTDHAARILDTQLRSNQALAQEWPKLIWTLNQGGSVPPHIWKAFAVHLADVVRNPNPLHFLAQTFIGAQLLEPAVILYKQARRLGVPVQQIDQLLAQNGPRCADSGPVSRWFDGRLQEPVDENRLALLTQAARFFMSTGRIMRALKAMEAQEVVAGVTAETRFNMGHAYDVIGRHEDALACVERAIALGLDNQQAWDKKARILASLRRIDEAVAAMDTCLTHAPDYQNGLQQKAIWLERLNHLEEADSAALTALDRQPGNIDLEILRLRIARRRKDDASETLEKTKALIASDAFRNAKPEAQVHGYFELAEQCDKGGSYEDAWTAYMNGNRAALATRQGKAINTDTYPDQIKAKQAALETVTKDMLPAKTDDLPIIFFVGFPRSGTTLMEQILDSHPSITTLDEKPLLAGLMSRLEGDPSALQHMDEGKRQELQQIYLKQAGFPDGAPEGTFILDKLPLNLINLDVIRFIFPGAKIIMALRDPRDSCLSNLAQNFVLNEAMVQFTEPVTTAALYDQVMTYYEQAEASLDLDLFQYRYEDLIDDQEAVLKKMIAFLGLAWTDDLLDHTKVAASKFISTPSYEKVQAPVNNSAVARWKNYWPWLEEPFAPLNKWADRFGYEN